MLRLAGLEGGGDVDKGDGDGGCRDAVPPLSAHQHADALDRPIPETTKININ